MSSKLSKNQLEKFSRQIILKDIGILGQKKILNSRVLIIGMGGLGCPVAEFLTRSGVGSLGIVDHDIVGLSNIHRQTLYDEKDLGKLKVKAAKKKLISINSKTKINIHNFKLDKKKFIKIIKKYDYIIDGIDNFETKFLINDISLKYKKFLVTGAISKFDGHIFTFDFSNKKDPCLRCFYQEETISDDILNCEYEGILGTIAAIDLITNEKDRAENIMIVDLLRNDLSKVCEIGSIEVPEILKLESYLKVHHLTSVIRGKLKKDKSWVDLLIACWPGGSITGAPKLRSCQRLFEIEKNGRGPYCGSFIKVDWNGEFDSNILIRSFVVKNKQINISAGCGIVSDSDPQNETEELKWKLLPLIDSLK